MFLDPHLVICDQKQLSSIGHISSSTHVHLANKSTDEHLALFYHCDICVPSLSDITTEPGWGEIPSDTLSQMNTVLIIDLWTFEWSITEQQGKATGYQVLAHHHKGLVHQL